MESIETYCFQIRAQRGTSAHQNRGMVEPFTARHSFCQKISSCSRLRANAGFDAAIRSDCSYLGFAFPRQWLSSAGAAGSFRQKCVERWLRTSTMIDRLVQRSALVELPER
jgi:hypothetical protein